MYICWGFMGVFKRSDVLRHTLKKVLESWEIMSVEHSLLKCVCSHICKQSRSEQSNKHLTSKITYQHVISLGYYINSKQRNWLLCTICVFADIKHWSHLVFSSTEEHFLQVSVRAIYWFMRYFTNIQKLNTQATPNIAHLFSVADNKGKKTKTNLFGSYHQ